MREIGIVPLFTHDDEVLAGEVVHACYEAGIRAFEFTNRRQNSYQVFSHLVSRKHLFPGLFLGIGTILDVATTQRFIDAGASFIISPIMRPTMGEVCARHHVPWIPGCATLTEMVEARDAGAAVIKVFPGSVLGPAFVRAVMPVVPDLNLMITGGVEPTRESLMSWFQAGAMCVGMGSQLFSSALLSGRNWSQLTARVSDAVKLVKEIRA